MSDFKTNLTKSLFSPKYDLNFINYYGYYNSDMEDPGADGYRNTKETMPAARQNQRATRIPLGSESEGGSKKDRRAPSMA